MKWNIRTGRGNNQKQVNEPAADAAEQAEKPKNSENDGYPKQHILSPLFVCGWKCWSSRNQSPSNGPLPKKY